MHLQHLGFPIANDALYLHSNVAKRSKRNTTADRAAKLTAEKTSATTANDEESCVASASESEVSCGSEREQQAKVSTSNEDGDCERSDVAQDESSKTTNSNFVVDPLCTHCPNLEPSGCVSYPFFLRRREPYIYHFVSCGYYMIIYILCRCWSDSSWVHAGMLETMRDCGCIASAIQALIGSTSVLYLNGLYDKAHWQELLVLCVH